MFLKNILERYILLLQPMNAASLNRFWAVAQWVEMLETRHPNTMVLLVSILSGRPGRKRSHGPLDSIRFLQFTPLFKNSKVITIHISLKENYSFTLFKILVISDLTVYMLREDEIRVIVKCATTNPERDS